MEDCHKDIVLIGGGHSNIQVLKILSQEWLYMKKNFGIKMRFTLISDHPTAFYSGMLPGYIAGMYNIDEIQIQLQPLCNWCGANFILDTAISIDEKEKIVYCKERNVKYDILSIDVGSTTKGMDIEGVKEFAICTRPLSNLLEKLENFEKEKNELNHIPKVIIVGGGAAGVELSFVFKARFMKKYKNVEVTLIDSNPVILERLGSWVSNKVTSKLNEKNIKIQNSSYVQKITKETVFLSNEKQIPYDLIIWATGAAPPALNNGTNLEKDQYGFIRVLDTLQSISSPYIFVSGDCASIDGYSYVTKAGVYAVREGPIVAKNILQMIKINKSLKLQELNKDNYLLSLTHYEPQKEFLALLTIGNGEAISSWKGLAFSGTLIWKLKDTIDKGFMNKFNVSHLGIPPKTKD